MPISNCGLLKQLSQVLNYPKYVNVSCSSRQSHSGKSIFFILLIGKTPTEKALVDQWLEYVSLHLQDNSETTSNLKVRKYLLFN